MFVNGSTAMLGLADKERGMVLSIHARGIRSFHHQAPAARVITKSAAPSVQRLRIWARLDVEIGAAALDGKRTLYALTGLAIFLTCCSPMSVYSKGKWFATWSCTLAEMQTPPGCAIDCRRAAMFTP